ncbi:MAG TPA: hypothetical protein VMH91_00855 [Candidatus Paceibacterota bacterium]|nr:hypothetical protein [Candidatus Paceibacterota bacterium]
MLYLYLGTDRKKARDAMNAAIKKLGQRERVHITDAHSMADLDAALSGGGMFGDVRAVILDGVFANEELRERLIARLPTLKDSPDAFFIFEEKLDAATKRAVSKYAEKTDTFDAAKGERDNAIFRLRFALEKGDKKTLWVGLMKEAATGKAPEAVHGFLFWAAKQIVLNARGEQAVRRGRTLLARLAELPHESRRKGVELEYALERFVLTEV